MFGLSVSGCVIFFQGGRGRGGGLLFLFCFCSFLFFACFCTFRMPGLPLKCPGLQIVLFCCSLFFVLFFVLVFLYMWDAWSAREVPLAAFCSLFCVCSFLFFLFCWMPGLPQIWFCVLFVFFACFLLSACLYFSFAFQRLPIDGHNALCCPQGSQLCAMPMPGADFCDAERSEEV